MITVEISHPVNCCAAPACKSNKASNAAKLAIPGLPHIAAMRHNAGSTACIDKDKWAYALVIWRFLNHSPGRIEASHNKSALPNQRRESLLKRVDRLNQALLPRADDVRIA